MPTTTFKNKLNPKQTIYNFTESELDRLMEVIKELGADIEIVCGISFNKGLAKIARKKA